MSVKSFQNANFISFTTPSKQVNTLILIMSVGTGGVTVLADMVVGTDGLTLLSDMVVH